jgi:hypothetical protein
MARRGYSFKTATTAPKKVQIGKGISISRQQHEDLLKHLIAKIEFGNSIRSNLCSRFEGIDREMSGYVNLDEKDRRRDLDNKRGYGPKPTDVNLQLVDAQLDETVTFLLSVIAPDSGIYEALAEKEKQQTASAFAQLMNQHAQDFGHYRNLAASFSSMLRYNLGGFIVEWAKVHGNIIENTNAGGFTVKQGVVKQGNSIEALDMYNFIWDISVNPVDLSKKGEFFAIVQRKTTFTINRMFENEELFGKDRLPENFGSVAFTSYYRARPTIATGNNGLNMTDWSEVLSAGVVSGEIGSSVELIHYYGWLSPAKFGLNAEKKMQIWRFAILNSKYICDAEQLNNAHGVLPVAIGMPFEDGNLLQTKSAAEKLIPLQRFASFQMNVHQRSARKKLYGITFYDKKVIPLDELGDMVAGTVPVKPNGQDFDIRKAVYQINDGPDTARTLNDIEAVDTLMQKILPTSIAKQVADLERATMYQAAATVQGANRRNLKMAKLINDQCMNPARDMQMYNIFQYQDSMEIVDETGEKIQINPSEFRNANLQFVISEGMKGIDKLMIQVGLKDLINVMLQSPNLQGQVDLVGVIDYWLSMLGDRTDFTQFKFKTQFDALPPDQKNIAFQLLQNYAQQQQAGGGNNGA